jgi:hypothetical protein
MNRRPNRRQEETAAATILRRLRETLARTQELIERARVLIAEAKSAHDAAGEPDGEGAKKHRS